MNGISCSLFNFPWSRLMSTYNSNFAPLLSGVPLLVSTFRLLSFSMSGRGSAVGGWKHPSNPSVSACQAPSNSCRSDSGSCLKSSIVKPLPWAPTHQQSLPVQWLNISEYNDRMIDIDWWWLDSKVCRVLSYQVISSLRSSWTACAAAFGLSFSLWRFVKALRARFIKIFKVVSSV